MRTYQLPIPIIFSISDITVLQIKNKTDIKISFLIVTNVHIDLNPLHLSINNFDYNRIICSAIKTMFTIYTLRNEHIKQNIGIKPNKRNY